MSERAIRAAHDYLDGRTRRRALVVDPHLQTTAGGRSIVRFQQHFDGIPLFGGDLALHVDGGDVVRMDGAVVDQPPAGDGTPDISATDAVSAAIAHFRARTDRSVCAVRHRSLRGAIPAPSVIASFPFPTRPTVLRIGRTESQPSAHLAYWRDHDALRLVWVVRAPFRALTYLLLVAADGQEKGRVVFCSRWSSGACFGSVFSFDHAAGRKRTQFPIPLSDFPPFLPHPNSALLGPWVATNATEGNNAITLDGSKQKLLQAAMAGGALEFPPFAANSKEQVLLNAFFYCNFLHDFFLMLGFGEAEGNFQLKNATTTKGGNDRLELRVFDQKSFHIADMRAKNDGEKAQLSLNRAPSNEPSALHAELVIHEYTHGVVHRMVGGRIPIAILTQQQSIAMDEGWADYFAITLRNRYLAAPNYNFADWAGIFDGARSASYAPNVQRDYGAIKPHMSVNAAGEIFAAALIRFNEFLGQKLGNPDRGHCIGWRAVVESLRIVTGDPHFLQGREALLAAVGELELGAVITPAEAAHARDAAREGFAANGMGRNARSVSAAFGGTTSDFNP
jgi:extracellular elastinolytic metalloproteinase